jgi:hypothetical protein
MPSLVQSRGNNRDLKQSARERKQAEEVSPYYYILYTDMYYRLPSDSNVA